MRNFNVNLTFTANTQQAKTQMKDLQSSLSQLSNSIQLGSNMKKSMMDVKSTIDQVKIAFQQATDPSTGQININTLRNSLNAFGLDANKIKSSLGTLGAEGQLAFLKIQNSVQNAQMPLKTTDTILTKMWGTLKNTARWQMSSAALMAVTKTFSDAFRYAKELNESLNNIRIVTGYNTAQMDKFAKAANKAAKALSVSTTAYTDAALIYYQQGLADEEVLKRAEVTVKLANAVGESAKTVSEWMTAVWNNFDDGSKSLEYYADVMAALGAATASSADEIAQGLEKFAAIADTVGLSYEYATAALTTVTAQTRQSADVVGTAFKTMFARMQDLELGKTLEDGTSLGEYAETLDKVGVKVLDASGELRAMDAVLNDLGARWDKLSNAERVAVAQGVAGIRQYSQMLALMDNWESFQDNLFIAQSAEGSLDEQADIYAESWEAASKRVKASAQGIYDSILNDKVFIKFNNQIADMLEGVEYLIDAMGGLPGILSLVSFAMLKAFGPQMLVGLTNFKTLVQGLTGQTAELAKQTKMSFASKELQSQGVSSKQIQNTAQAITTVSGTQTDLDSRVQNLAQKLPPDIAQSYAALRDEVRMLGDEYTSTAMEADKAKNAVYAASQKKENAGSAYYTAGEEYKKATTDLDTAKRTEEYYGKKVDQARASGDSAMLAKYEEKYATAMQNTAQAEKNVAVAEDKVKSTRLQLDNATDELTQAEQKHKQVKGELKVAEDRYSTAAKNANNTLAEQEQKMARTQAWMTMATAVSSLSFGLSSLQSIISVLNNEDMSWGEKLLSILTSVSMTLPMVIMGFKALNKEVFANIGAGLKSALVKLGTVVPANTAEAKARTASARAGQWFTKNVKTGKTAKYTGKLNASGAPTKMISGAGGSSAASAGTSWGSALSSAGPALLAVGAIIAGVTLAVGAVKLFQKEYNKAENAAKEAAKHAKVMREEYTKVAEETKKMQEAFSAYDDAINKTRQLAKGTLEYKQALMEANEKAWDLINTYGLTTSDYKIVNGEVIISDEAKTRALEEQMNEQRKAQMASAQAQTNANSARIEANKVAAARKVDINDGWQEAGQATYGAATGAASGALIGAGVGSFIPVIGTAVGALVGGLIGAITGGIAAGTQDAASETETKLVDELTERALSNEDLSVEGLQSSIDALKGATDEEVQALINAAESNAKLIQANEALYDQIGLQIAEMRGIESEQSGVVGNWAKDADKRMDPLYNTLLEQLDDNDEQLQNLYALYNDGGRLENMIGDDITVRDKDGNLVGGKKNAFKQRDIAKQTIEKMRADIEANPDDYKIGSEKYEALMDIAGSGNGGFAAMIQPILKEYGLLTEELEQDLAMSRERAQELGDFDIFKNNDAAKTAFLDQMDAVSRGEKGERLNLAEAGLSWQDIEELEKDLYANWDKYDDTNVQLEQAIRNYGEDIKTVVKEANDAFDADAMLADQEASVQSLAGIDAQVFATYVDSLENATGTTEEFATELAKVNLTLESSVKSLGKNFKQYGKAFAKGDKTTLEWSQGVTAIKKDLSNMFEGFEPDTAFTEALISSGQLSDLLDSENVEKDFLDLLEQVTDAMVQNANVPGELGAILQAEFARIKAEDLTQGTLLSSTDFNFDVFRNAAKDGKLDLQQFIQILQTQGFRYTGDIENLKEDGNLDYNSFEAEDFEFIGLGTANLIELIEELNEEIDIDRYHDLEEALKDLSEATTYYGKVREKLYNESDSWWNKELANVRENIRLLEQYRDRAERFIQIDYDAIIASAHENGIAGAPTIDPDNGRITNWVELQENNRGIDKKQWDEFKQSMLDYENTLNTYEAKSYELAEAKLEYLDQSIAKVAEETEKLTTLTEDSMKMLEFQFEHLGESAVDIAERIANIGQQMEATFNNKDYYTQGLESLFANYKDSDGNQIFGKDAYDKLLAGDLSFLKEKPVTEEFAKQIRSIRDGLIETYNSLDGFKEKIQEEVINGFEKLTDEFEDNSKALEHNMKILEGYRNVIDLLGKDMLGISDEVLAQASTAAVNIAVTQMKGAKEQFEFAKNALAEAEKALVSGIIDEEAFEKIQDSYREAELGLTETLESSIEAINSEFDNSLNQIMNNFDKSVGGTLGSLDKVQEWFDKQEELEDFYLKPYEKTYEINTLNREIQDAIQNSDNLKYQKELNELSSELLQYQEEGVEMSDQDLEYMQKRFEVMKAQAAFEEAQNAKREVRLTRDSQGNYGYVYTANEEAVNKAQADLDKSIYELEKHFDEVQSSLSSMYLKTTQEYADAVAALDKTSETYEQDLQRVTDFYSQRLGQIEGEISESLKRAAQANEDYGVRAKTAFNELVIGQMYNDIDTFNALHTKVIKEMQNATSVIEKKHQEWGANINAVFTKAGIDVTAFGETYAKVIKNDDGTGVEDITNSLAISLEGLSDSAKTGFEGIVDVATEQFTEFDNKIKAYKTALDGLLPKLNEFLEKAGLAKDAQVPGAEDTPGGNPIDSSDQWKVTGYTKISDGQGSWTHGLKVENLNDSSKNKIIAADDISAFKSIDSSSAFSSHKEANEIHKESSKIGKAIAEAKGREVYEYKQIEDQKPTIIELPDNSTISSTLLEELGAQGVVTAIDHDSALTPIYTIKDRNNNISYITGHALLGSTKYNIGDIAYIIEDTNLPSGRLIRAGKKSNLIKDWSIDFSKGTATTKKPQTWTYDNNGDPLSLISIPSSSDYWDKLKSNKISWIDSSYLKNDKHELFGLHPSITFKDKYGDTHTTSYINETDLGQFLGIDAMQLWRDINQIAGLNTGGYTGSWGPEGRIAMLHQKEIVLNAHDTENFLTAIQIVRSMADKLELSARAAQQGLGALVHASTIPGEKGSLEQTVTIHAEFPNATNHSEIEEAFRNLANKAAQYAAIRR